MYRRMKYREITEDEMVGEVLTKKDEGTAMAVELNPTSTYLLVLIAIGDDGESAPTEEYACDTQVRSPTVKSPA